MWISALLGMCTKFAEVTLAIHFREKNKDGDWVGGPMYYMKNGLGWGLYGGRCIEFIFGHKSIKIYTVAYALISIVGATVDLGLIWGISDTFNGFMVVPNLIAVFLLSPVLLKLVKAHFAKRKI